MRVVWLEEFILVQPRMAIFSSTSLHVRLFLEIAEELGGALLELVAHQIRLERSEQVADILVGPGQPVVQNVLCHEAVRVKPSEVVLDDGGADDDISKENFRTGVATRHHPTNSGEKHKIQSRVGISKVCRHTGGAALACVREKYQNDVEGTNTSGRIRVGIALHFSILVAILTPELVN